MTAHVLPDAIAALRQEIERAVSAALKEFEAATGVTPSAIRIELADITTHECKVTRRAVSAVRVSLDEL